MKKVLLLLLKGTEIFEAGAFYDVLGWAGEYGSEPVKVVTAGVTEEITCTFGLKVKTDFLVEDIVVDSFDGLVLPGGFEEFGFYEEAFSVGIANLIREFEEKKKPIASICVGALPLAYSGILERRKATTYHKMGGRRRKQLAEFGVEVLDKAVVCDRQVVTSTAPSASAGAAFKFLELLTDKENTEKIKDIMGFGEEEK